MTIVTLSSIVVYDARVNERRLTLREAAFIFV